MGLEGKKTDEERVRCDPIRHGCRELRSAEGARKEGQKMSARSRLYKNCINYQDIICNLGWRDCDHIYCKLTEAVKAARRVAEFSLRGCKWADFLPI